ncbi:MAG: bifunctional DNA primase/polymerase [Bacteroidota bacterium]
MTQNNLLEAALKYASKGLPVFPCTKEKTERLNPKQPLTKNGFYDATTDHEQIKRWWQQHPDALIGMPTGEKSGMWVLDVDSYKPEGQQSFEWLIKNNGDLPKTCTSKTGGGGKQFFFQWPGNGTNIKNSGSVIAKSVDVRGNGGYVVLPPSGHPSGGQYEWIEKVPPAKAPDWLIDLVKEKPELEIKLHTGDSGAYGKKALAEEMMKLAAAGNGTRNNTLNECAYSLGQLIAGGELEHDHVVNSLLIASQTIGLKTSEARKTIQSGIKSGAQTPRKAPEKDDIQYDFVVDQQNQQNHHFQHSQHQSAKISIDQQKSASDQHNQQDSNKEPPYNLKATIFQFIENSKGSFTTRDVDTELGLSTRREKNARSTALRMAREKNLIKRDKKVAGKYNIVDTEVDWVDWDAEEEEAYPINLPFGLHEQVKIPPKAIIVLAGSSDAGKTAFMLNTLRENLEQKYDILYLMSEMGGGEFKSRVKSFQDPISKWKKVKPASKSYDFDSTVEHYNPDGLTCIDYLEEVDGEYYKIPTQIRYIYDALNQGVAFIAIQKRKASEMAVGGEGTKEKARLYMILDYLATGEHCIYCALKIEKAKGFINKNLRNYELHFKLTRGTHIEAITDWMPCAKVDRQKCAAMYEAERNDLQDKDFIIPTIEGKQVVIKQKDWQKWQDNMENIDVEWELKRIAEDSYKKPFLKYKGYFFQVSNLLKKTNEERSN